MTITSTSCFTTATGNGATTSFPFDFPVSSPDDVDVMVNGALQGSGFTVTVDSDGNGGTVSFTTPPVSGAAVLLALNPSFMQAISFENAGAYNPASVDNMGDEGAVRDIYLKGRTDRSIRAPLGETLNDLPSAADRQGAYLAFDSGGNPIVSSNLFTLAAGATVTTRTALANIAGPADLQSAVLAESGREGTFVFDSSDLSAEVAADPGQWNYVAPASDTTGASGAWVRKTRAKLTADRTFYVRTDGSDSHDGSANTSGSAFATIQHAIDVAYNVLDLNGHVVTVAVAAGTYTNPITVYGPLVGGSNARPLDIVGDETTPGNVIISTTNDTALKLGNYAYLFLAGVKVQTTTGGYGLLLNDHSTLQFRNIELGNVAVDMIRPQKHCTVEQVSNDNGTASTLTVSGDANAFVHFTDRSLVKFTNQRIVYNGNTFATYLYGGNNASLLMDGVTFDTSLGKPSGGITAHDQAFINVQSSTGDWNGGQTPVVQDASVIASDGYNSRTFYIRKDGNDGNRGTGDTAADAFLTIQGCISALSKFPRDPAWWNATSGVRIICRTGTYSEGVNLYDLPFSSASIEGDEVTPSNVVLASPSDGFVASGLSTLWTVKGFKITAAGGSSLRVERGSRLLYQNLDFGTATANHRQVKTGGFASATGPYTISGGAARSLLIQSGGIVDDSSCAVTITGTPAFSQCYAQVSQGGLYVCSGGSFTGSATGKRFILSAGGTIDTGGGGTSFLPGNAAGTGTPVTGDGFYA